VGVALITEVVVRRGATLHKAPVGTAGHRGLLSWDGDWYFRIARHGYDSVGHDGLRFFPLLPLLARGLAPVTGGVGPALIIIAGVASLAFAALLHRLVATDTGDRGLAQRSAWLVSLAPMAFVLVMGYTEALAGALAVAAFLGARQRRWHWAAVAGLLAGALRPSGILLVAPLAWEGARRFGKASGHERAWIVTAVAAPVVGTVPYLAWVQAQYGDWKLPYSVQQADYLRGGWANPIGRVVDALSNLDGGDLVLGLRGVWVLVAGALLIVAARRLPGSYVIFAAVTLVVAASTEHLGSVERYAYGAFPLVVAAATLIEHPDVERAVLAISGAAMSAYALLAFLDLYVP